MEKLLKKILGFGIVTFLIFIIFKLYLKIRAVINLNSSLPEYLKSIYEEEVVVDISLAINQILVRIKCSPALLEKKELVQRSIEDYIEDFYPELKVKFLKIKLEEEETE